MTTQALKKRLGALQEHLQHIERRLGELCLELEQLYEETANQRSAFWQREREHEQLSSEQDDD